jgi:hypothetical protein
MDDEPALTKSYERFSAAQENSELLNVNRDL